MAYTRNGKPLLGGSWGEQRTGAAEQNSLQFSLIQLIEKISAQGNGAAAAAGTTCMDILNGVVKYHCSAICQLSAQGQMISFSQFQKHFLADLSQITGDDQVEILWLSVHILHVGLYGLKCSRGHCQV